VTPAAELLLAAIETRVGNHTLAEQHYRTVLEADPDQVVALNNLAVLLAQYGSRPDEALKYAQKAKELAPGNPDIGGTIGWLYYRKGLYTTALDYLKDAVGRDGSKPGPNPGARRYYLGMTHLKLGNRSQGMEILQQALRSNPELPEAEQARAAIQDASKTLVR
jgi:tetratricopeptide (TPR) repeat protein